MNNYSLISQLVALWIGFLYLLYIVIWKPLIRFRKQRSEKEHNKKCYNIGKGQLFCPKCKGENVSTKTLVSFNVCRVCHNYWAK